MSKSQATPVLIVGGGPVGLSLSIDLSWRGVPHVLVERGPRAARAEHPRMDQVGVRSMEHFRRLGIASEVEAAGFPRGMRRDCVFATGVLGLELAREPFEADATRPAPPFSPQKHELCPQNFLDPALQTVAERSPTADVRYGTELLGFEERDGGVQCEVSSPEGRRLIAADYLVGCDGSGSAVASRMAVGRSKETTLACSTNIFIQSQTLRHRAGGPGAYRYILIGAEGVWASMVNIDGRDTWRLQVLGDAERPDWTEGQARAVVDRAIGADADYQVASIVPWYRRELIVDRFAAGRCFLMGDAAHQFSPTGGYGMNTGLGEAFNLAWKLAAVLEGWGGAALLASYEAERRPVAIRNAERATVNFERMRAANGSQSPAAGSPASLLRIGRETRERMREEWDSMGIHLGYSYGGSPVIVDDGDALPHAHPAEYRQTARPGARAPHAWLADGRSTLDLFGRGFVLLQFGEAASPDLVNAAGQAGVPLRCCRIADPRIRRLYGHDLVVVRPDGHVALACDESPPDAAGVIDRIRGTPPAAVAAPAALRTLTGALP